MSKRSCKSPLDTMRSLSILTLPACRIGNPWFSENNGVIMKIKRISAQEVGKQIIDLGLLWMGEVEHC